MAQDTLKMQHEHCVYEISYEYLVGKGFPKFEELVPSTGVGKMGVGKMGVGKMGVGEMGLNPA